MIVKNNLTPELKRVFKYIQDKLVTDYPTKVIGIEYFIVGVLDNEKCTAYQIIDKTMLSNGKNTLKSDLITYLKQETDNAENDEGFVPKFEDIYDKYLDNLMGSSKNKINSAQLLLEILKNNRGLRNTFSLLGVNMGQLNNALSSLNPETAKGNQKKHKKGFEYKVHSLTDEYVPQLYEMSNESAVNFIGNKSAIQSVFVAFSKFDCNNALLLGERGVGKTAIVKQIAQMIYHGEAPLSYRNHIIVNFKDGLHNLMQHFNEILNDAQERGCYIFFVPDIDLLIYDGSPYVDMVKQLLANKAICVIATTIEERYNRVDADKHFPKLFKKIKVDEKTETETVEILKENKELYEVYHDVKYSDTIINECVKLTKKYIPDAVLPQTAIDVFDEVGAFVDLKRKEDTVLSELKTTLIEIQESKEQAAVRHDDESYEAFSKDEVSISSEIEKRKKELSFSNTQQEIDIEDLHEIIENISSVPVSDIKTEERERLLTLEKHIKEKVIGQDEAVSEVVKTVKRQRVGLGKQGKPSVMMFVGNSGTGKTYLSKVLAKELFGDEKSFVRIDMSEYNDKTSVNKIYGSSAGYVGYENGGILTEAVKKHSHCVLLLDEIEKAADEVHDVFLQLFDEGRLTDNKGVTVDFSNCIIIMTSNIGTKEALLRGNGVGFNKNEKMGRDIINAEISKRFKPEFVNRIDNIIMFNTLTNDDIKRIIRVELNELEKRVNNIGHTFNNTFIDEATDYIFAQVEKENGTKNYGARPVVRLIRNIIENKLTDLIIVDDLKEHCFSFDEVI